MVTVPLLRDLFAHLEWAESRVWQATVRTPGAMADAELHERLQHIHLTQRAFMDVWHGRPVDRYMDFRLATLGELYDWARPYYDEIRLFIAALDDGRLDTPTPVPWARFFTEPPGREPVVTTLGETLLQVQLHSHYHRAQVNSRIRALGGEPLLVDHIAWLWAGRPAPSWPDGVPSS